MKAKIITLAIFFIFHQNSNAQNLPSKQTNSVVAPHLVLIDGNLNEWPNRFQAFSKSTQLFYTLSNDESNIYLIIRSGDPIIAQKMLYGITFSLSSDPKRVSASAPSFTSPLLDWKVRSPIISALKKHSKTKTKVREIAADSAIHASNKLLRDFSKVNTTGLVNMRDTLTFIKDSEVIKAAAQFDKEFALTYELAVPLKNLNLKGKKLVYNVKLNGSSPNSVLDGNTVVTSGSGGATVAMTYSSSDLIIHFATDFSGEYTLAGK